MGNPEEAAAAAAAAAESVSDQSLPSVLSIPDDTENPNAHVPSSVTPHTVVVQNVPSRKTLCDAYLLCLPPLGLLGAHHYYLRRPGFGAAYTFTLGLLGVGWLVDWFRMPLLVREYNDTVLNQHLKRTNRKKLSEAYVLWFPFGLLGFHHYYLRRWPWAVAYTFTFGLLGIGWIIDGFRMKWLVDSVNRELDQQEEIESRIQASPDRRNPREKRLLDAYVIGVSPFGLLGFHNYYMGRYGFGVIYTCTLGLLGIGWILDWFRMKWLVRRANKEIRGEDNGFKHLDDAYVLCFPLGFLGLHHFYLNRPGWGSLYLFTFGCLGIGWICDWFRLPWLVKNFNRQIEEERRIVAEIRERMGPSTHVIITRNSYVAYPAQNAVTQEGHLQGAAVYTMYGTMENTTETPPGQNGEQILRSPPAYFLEGEQQQPPSYDSVIGKGSNLGTNQLFGYDAHPPQGGATGGIDKPCHDQDDASNTEREHGSLPIKKDVP